MIFLGPLYNYIANTYAMRINHFPLIRLSFYAIDKAILYTIFFIILRFIWLKAKHRKAKTAKEFWIVVFAFYVLLLFALTVFRDGYFIWQFKFYWHRPLSQINIKPMVETLKLVGGKSLVDFIYNLYGNIFWFIPMGFFLPALNIKKGFFKVILTGMLISVSIEAMQFVLNTGVTDIDDVIFNTVGTVVGYLLYWICFKVKKRINI
ncbi:VanZ family protein [Companilactobacillus keshanensis]|uniref:VanZ family protein n=1 Tax=Companilactobacillus keshanensis TaxID=2486003 RepID=A0ABW4BWZ3_9LACO|nr:VanZ family protein [Companilactobacillus keshanensis]